MRRVPPLLIAVAVVLLAAALVAQARPPKPAGSVRLAEGHVPSVCQEGKGSNSSGASFGVYYSERSDAWISAPWCYARWGNLYASSSQVVKAGGRVTIAAVPSEGSNSAEYAPETKSITWRFPGRRVSGCGNADLTCTVIPFGRATDEWQWGEFHVTMPRTFFVDSRGSNCAGQHLCAGFATNAWAWAGVPPKGQQPAKIVATVVDDEGRPLPGVTVSAEGKSTLGGASDGAGKVTLDVSGKSLGSYKVRTVLEDVEFEPASKVVRVTSGSTAKVRFRAKAACANKSAKAAQASKKFRRYEGEVLGPGGELMAQVTGIAVPCQEAAAIRVQALQGCDRAPSAVAVLTSAAFSGYSAPKRGKLPATVASMTGSGATTGTDQGVRGAKGDPARYTLEARGVGISEQSMRIDSLRGTLTFTRKKLTDGTAITCSTDTTLPKSPIVLTLRETG